MEDSEIILEIKNHFDAADAHGGEDGGDDNDEKAAAGELCRGGNGGDRVSD